MDRVFDHTDFPNENASNLLIVFLGVFGMGWGGGRCGTRLARVLYHHTTILHPDKVWLVFPKLSGEPVHCGLGGKRQCDVLSTCFVSSECALHPLTTPPLYCMLRCGLHRTTMPRLRRSLPSGR